MACLAQSFEHGVMNNEAPTALILGGTGRTGSLLADGLAPARSHLPYRGA
jgi:hypothetical protein